MPARRILCLRRTASLLLLLAVACHADSPAPHHLRLTSPGFSGAIPDRYASCSGQTGNAPPLAWDTPPPATRSFVLIVTDPDAPVRTFTHWLLWNLPPDTRSLPASIPTQPQLPNGARQGRNDFGHLGYGGPCPPGHSTHRYVFDLYALDTTLTLSAGASRKQLLAAIRGHILATGRLTGRYSQ